MRTKLFAALIAATAATLASALPVEAAKPRPPQPVGNCYVLSDGTWRCYVNGKTCYYKDGKLWYCIVR